MERLPASVEVHKLILTNYEGNFSIDITAQFVMINLFFSLFSPTMKAEIMLHDPIGLLINFPIVGEEKLEVIFDRTVNSGTRNLEFRVSRVKDIIPSRDGRSSTYTLELHTPEYVNNLKNRISRAYNEPIHSMIEKIVKSDLKTNKPIDVSDPTKGNQYVCIPNMFPIEAIKWLTKRAVGDDPKHINYVFFESFDGFEFKTLQKLATEEARNTYYYLNHIHSGNKELEPWSIMSLTINNRFNTSEKLALGFFENEYFEIDPLNKQFNVTRTTLKPIIETQVLGTGQLNTANCILSMQTTDTRDETTARTRYNVWSNDFGKDPPHFKDKFGEGAKLMAAFNQISLTVEVQGNADLDVGDVISIRIPEFHGFNKVDLDKYIQGNYLIADLKHQIGLNGAFVTVMNLNRDAYSTHITDTEYDKTMGLNSYKGPK